MTKGWERLRAKRIYVYIYIYLFKKKSISIKWACIAVRRINDGSFSVRDVTCWRHGDAEWRVSIGQWRVYRHWTRSVSCFSRRPADGDSAAGPPDARHTGEPSATAAAAAAAEPRPRWGLTIISTSLLGGGEGGGLCFFTSYQHQSHIRASTDLWLCALMVTL